MRPETKTGLTDLFSVLWPRIDDCGRHDDLIFRPFCPQNDTSTVQTLADDALGTGYLDVVSRSIAEHLFVAEKAGRTIGFAVVYDDYAKTIYAQRLRGRPDTCPIPDEARVSVLSAIALHADYRGQGIGYRLLRHAIHLYPSYPMFTLAWKPKSRAPYLERVLHRSGFARIAHYPDFWRDDSVRRGYICPVCWTPCSCDMQLYLRLPHPAVGHSALIGHRRDA